ncbi:hypothetical protein ACFOHY_25465 [Rhizobium rosettiformans]|uniref:hypothetical protein n=1 Tax=Rhizobium rosettiformans TaxID=1368430 RepID=UPI00361FD4FD
MALTESRSLPSGFDAVGIAVLRQGAPRQVVRHGATFTHDMSRPQAGLPPV